MEGDGLLE